VCRIMHGRPVIASVQIRKDPGNPLGFSWMQGLQVKYDSVGDTWGVSLQDKRFFRFVRVGPEEARLMQSARSGEDWM